MCSRANPLRLGLWRTARFSFTAVDGVVTSRDRCVPSCGMDSRGTKPRAVFARGGTHRGSVLRRSAALPQVLFLFEGSLTYYGVWRLAKGWLLFFSFPSAARGHLLSPLSFSRLHTLCVWALVALASELFPPPQAACGWDVVVLSPCASSPVRGTGAATLRAPLTW